MEHKGVHIHPSAEVSDKAQIGVGTKIWHQAQIRENTVIGENCIISKGVYIDFSVKIGNNCKFQNGSNMYHGLTVEDDVFVGPGVIFTNDMYPRARIWSDELVVATLVKRGASIGANSTIRCGITIGEDAMVGAGSVVTKDVPSNGLVFGNPARLKGFVCRCGNRLEKPKKGKSDVEMACKACKSKVNIPLKTYKEMKK